MLMLVGGNFDLPVGAMACMSGVTTGALMKFRNFPVPLAVFAGLLIAVGGGFLNGFMP